jgi:hypothetical protein
VPFFVGVHATALAAAFSGPSPGLDSTAAYLGPRRPREVADTFYFFLCVARALFSFFL